MRAIISIVRKYKEYYYLWREMIVEQLAYCLSHLKKNELQEIADYFEFDIESGMKKADLLHEVARRLCEDPVDWLNKLPSRDIQLLLDLLDSGVDRRVEADGADSFTIVELLKLVDSVYIEDYYRKITLCKPLGDLIAPFARELFEDNRRNGRYMIESVIIGYLSIYGVISGQDLVDILFRDIDLNEDVERISNMIAECPIIKIYREEVDGEPYFVSPEMFSIDYVLEKRKELKQDSGYKYYPWPAAIEAGENFPYNFFGSDSKEYRDVLDMLQGLGYDRFDQEDILHEIWYKSQFAGDEIASESLFDCLSDSRGEFYSFDEYKRCIDIITAYANSLPKWVLRGRSANEAGMMKISIKVDDDNFADEEPRAPQYQCTALCNTSDKVGWAWMILSKSDTDASKFSKTVAS